jgi:prepilin-type N-terminal cleavage/methylation domain-containing protein
MKKAFSIIEILFSIIIISIISSIAIMSIFPIAKESYIVKSKLIISNIRVSLYNYQDLVDTNTSYPTTLDTANTNTKNQLLFSNILQYPILSTDGIEKKSGYFDKINDNIYRLYINSSYIDFEYNNGVFDCDYNNELCIKLNQ